VTESGWLIEDVWPDGAIVWWAGGQRFSSDHHEAIRFSRRADAEAAIPSINTNGTLKAVEHIWFAESTDA
jgi:hypothetical protein